MASEGSPHEMAAVPDKANRRELCEIICTQKEKLQRYEARLGDLVRAYKSLQKEKDALELSLKALTLSKASEKARASSSNESLTGKEQEKKSERSPASKADVQEDEGSPSDSAQGDASEDHVAALSQALSTLSEEKARMEAAFQADRKRLIQEKEAALRQVEEVQRNSEEQATSLEAKMTELRSKLREEQLAREQEQSDHAAMLRELQRLLSEERTLRENLEDKLEEATRKAAQADLAKEYETKVEKLTQELDEVRKRLLASEEKLRQPSPLLLKLQQELVEVKAQHQAALEQEKKRSGHAQARLHQQTSGSEARVASLESRLQELSQAVGTYDRLRMQDRAAIQRLRERLSQLAQENAALASAAGIGAKAAELPSQDSNLDVKTLLDRFGKMRLLLKESNQRAERPVDLIAYFRELAEEEVLGLHAKCREELRQLKDEFEQYKAHAHSVLQGTGSQGSYAKGQESSAELDRLRQQVKDLQGQLRTQRAQFEAQEQMSRETTTKLQRALSDADLRHEQERQRLEQRWSSKLSELESLMQAQRDRSLALVEEKDRELQALRATLASLESENQRYDWQAQREAVSSSGLAVDVSGDRDGSSDAQGDALDPLLSELLSKNLGFASKDGRSKAEWQLLHYAQELARKDAELLRTLREKRDVESALRDLQRSVLLKEQKDAQEREALRLRLSQLEHMPGPSDSGKVNLQYLKNVVLQYLLCNEAPARKHMLNAIAVGLRFTPREAQLARQAAQAWW
ncbi:GRIP and coiled-coil domain containing 88 kDa isoform X1 [Dermacentor variabilis]|uniref:GRIP and coiled-coil domain containing 88 kDa isoform X1 n=2 Tax=Dermacentor variabilis TaxID=34621 RepID=UPI003F5C3700